MTAIISPNRAIFVNVALRQTFFPFSPRDFSCSVTAEPSLACRRNSLSRIKLELVLTFLFTSCIGISRLGIRIPSELFFWRTLLSKQGNCLSRPSLDLLQVDREPFLAVKRPIRREAALFFFLLRRHTIKSSPFRKRLNCRIPYHLNNFLRSRLRGTQEPSTNFTR